MEFILVFFNLLFDLVAFGSSPAARYWLIVELSVVSALAFLWLFKLVSNQRRIKRYKNAIWGNILQMRIYQDSLRVIVTSIFKVLWYNLLYLKEMLLPLVVMLPVLVLLTMQVNNRCGYAPLASGAKAQVRVQVSGAESFESLQALELTSGGALELQTPALRVPDESAVYWRVGVRNNSQPGELTVSLGGKQVIKQAAVTGSEPERFGPVLGKWSWSRGLLDNAEGFLPADSPVESISIEYARRQYSLIWWDTDSLVVYFVLVLVFALAFKPLFRVTL